MNKSGVIEFEEFRKLIKKIFKAVHEGFGQFLEDKKKKDIELEKLDMQHYKIYSYLFDFNIY